MAQKQDVRPRVTITRSMPMQQWDRAQVSRQPEQEESIDQKRRRIPGKVLLRHFQEELDKRIGKTTDSIPTSNTNDNLQHEANEILYDIARRQARENRQVFQSVESNERS
jgi:hypothetical protein